MDNIKNLLIRACKSKNPKQRIKSVIKRFYCYVAPDLEIQMTEILSNNLIHFVDCSFDDIFQYFHQPLDKRSKDELFLDYLIFKIRFLDIDQLPKDYRIPARWRNK